MAIDSKDNQTMRVNSIVRCAGTIREKFVRPGQKPSTHNRRRLRSCRESSHPKDREKHKESDLHACNVATRLQSHNLIVLNLSLSVTCAFSHGLRKCR